MRRVFPAVLVGILATLGFYSLGQRGPNVPAGRGPGAPPGGPLPPSVTPLGPPGLTFALPMVGQLYRPNSLLPETRAQDFPARHAVEQWAALETTPSDAPKERHDHIMRLLDAKQLDPPQWRRITVRPPGEGGSLEVEVTGDVASVGGVRLCGPMRTLQALADAWGGLICTPKIVDAIWRARSLPLAPQTIGWTTPGSKTTANPAGNWINPGGAVPWMLYYADLVAAEIQNRYLAGILTHPGALVAPVLSTLGKDYVLAPELLQHLDSCAIYGWTRSDGTVIQSAISGASYKHYLDYFDYSHSLRVVGRKCWIDGIEADLADVYRARPDWLNHNLGQGPIPLRHPAIPVRQAGGVSA